MRMLSGTFITALVLAAAPAVGVTAPARAATVITVTTTADSTTTDGSCSLREAVANADADSRTSADCASGQGADRIVFALGTDPVTLTLDPALGRLEVTDPQRLTIDGAGRVTLDGGGATEILYVGPGDALTVDGLTLEHGAGHDIGGGLVFGGALWSDGGHLVIRGSTFADNVLPQDQSAGGGLITLGATGSLDVSGSTVSANQAIVGGAIWINGTPTTIRDSTFVGNAAGNNGGAISSSHAPGDGTLHVSYSTFSGNGSVSGGALAGDAVVTASLFEGNTASSGATCDTPFDPPPVDGGYNVADDASCAFTADTSANDTAPLLDAGGLADHGGPTQTIALQDGSPAVDLVPSRRAGCGTTEVRDQRGFVRPADGNDDTTLACDAGAYEVDAVAPPPPTGRCTISGTPGPDVLRGTPGNDVICGGGGDDVITAGAGRDTIHGGPGADVLVGGTGPDLVTGGSGADTLRGYAGSDRLLGGSGPDDLHGDRGPDTLVGGPGPDHLVGGPGRDRLVP